VGICSSNFVNLQQLCIVPGKAAWIAFVVHSTLPYLQLFDIRNLPFLFYLRFKRLEVTGFFVCQDVYCLDADGSLLDAALLAAVAALMHCKSKFSCSLMYFISLCVHFCISYYVYT